ncbi:MAG: retroviral-like aspartic protease family protein [Ardenticatenaceae bacterium]|nr:retroviral-like aspartic protease family protein [Ardenticatenaceae bacterium]
MIIHTHDYDSGFSPPMPVIEIQIQRRAGQSAITLTAIVDSGADATMIPLRYLRQLRARKGQTKWLLGTAGGRYEVDLYTIAVQVGQHRALYLDVVGTERRDEVIVGRDLLNQYVVKLDAPSHTVEISE